MTKTKSKPFYEGTVMGSRACGKGLKAIRKFGSLQEAWDGLKDGRAKYYNEASDNMRWLVAVYGNQKPWPSHRLSSKVCTWQTRQLKRQQKLLQAEAKKRKCCIWELPKRVVDRIRRAAPSNPTCAQIRKWVTKKDLAVVIKAAMAPASYND